jgi:hypothetical protein
MALKIVDDVGAPALVTVVNIAARQASTVIMGQSLADVLTYGMAGGGYLAAYMGWGGRYNDFVKNVAIASAPLAFEKIYNKIKGTSVNRMARRVSRYPAPATEGPFQNARLV